MGEAISVVRKTVHQSTDENEKMANDALNTMSAVAREKLKTFALQVESNTNSRQVGVDKIIHSTQMICCSVSEDDKNLKETVDSLLSSICKGMFVDALTTGAKAALGALFSSMVGNEAEHSTYRVCVGRLGGIVRLDFNLYLYEFGSSNTFLHVVKNILVVSVIVSSVDPDTLDISTLRVIVGETCGDDIDTGKQLLKDILNEWKNDIDIRNHVKTFANSPSTCAV